MSLTQNQIDAIGLLLNGDSTNEGVKSINGEVNKILASRDHLLSLLQIHTSIDSETATSILVDLKLAAKNAAQAIVILCS